MSLRRLVVTAVLFTGVLGAAAPALAGQTTGSTCRKNCTTTTADTTAPTVSISSPAPGSTVASPGQASGSASDNVLVSRVDVQLDGGAWIAASGTSTWSAGLGTPSAGSHTLVARATDTSGNVRTVSESFSIAAQADTTAPSVTISAPGAGATVTGPFTATGSSADNTNVASVDVQVDSGAWQRATGTTSWSAAVDTAGLVDGNHTLSARATDAAGNASTTAVTFVTSTTTTSTSGPDITVTDPRATNSLQLLGRGRNAEWGSVSAILYGEDYTSRRVVMFRDSSSGTTSYVDLPSSDSTGWSLASYTMTSGSDLWVFGGSGPVVLRHYRLSGGSVPTAATLVSTQVWGDSDSRTGDLTKLVSGSLVAAWHQQGATGPQGQWVAYVPASGAAAQVLGPYTMGITKASKQVLGQHPADGSVWLFSEADATGTVVTATFTESASGLVLRSTDDAFLNVTKYGDNGPDPENPDLALAVDPATNTLALAYQDAHRVMFQQSPAVNGSWVTVARVPATGAPAFLVMPVYVERISSLALSVGPGETWLTYRPIDTSTMTFDHLYRNVYRNGAWGTPTLLGQLYSSWERLTYSPDRTEVTTRMADGRLHLFTT